MALSKNDLQRINDHMICDVAVDTDTIDAAGKSGQISPSMFDSIKNFNETDVKDPRLGCANYYRLQSNQEIGTKRIPAPVYIDRSSPKQLHQSWFSPLADGMQALNEAAPGLHLYEVSDKSAAKIIVFDDKDGGCWTLGNIILHSSVEISLDHNWSESHKRGTAIHEMMHALGFQHEHKRRDGDKYLKQDTSKLDNDWKEQYAVSKFVTGLNRFDPHSIMMYPLCEALQRKSEGDTVWKTKEGNEQCQVLSELDKVGLNILYRPVIHDGYKPSQSLSVTGLMYCGRRNFRNAEKDVIKRAQTDGVCGPHNWANCAACRVLKTEKSVKINQLGKWQGWTGLVYCGKYFGRVDSCHDGYCGPNNGPPCHECGELLYPGYTAARNLARNFERLRLQLGMIYNNIACRIQ